jgi:8-oxo-dGTP pyrophosphatase MutT (NUDIX family)
MPVAPRDAATVVLLRDGDAGVETCLLQRSSQLDFVAGAHVFPGGALEAEDVTVPVVGIADAVASAQAGVDQGGAAFWAAAVRECFEEAGVLPAMDGVPTGAELSRLRQDLHAGRTSMAALMERVGVAVDASRLRCIARWVTPPESPRRYDTRFFLAAMPPGQVVDVDGREVVSHRWVTPSDALALHRRGEIELIFPTARTLARLEPFTTVDEAMDVLVPLDTTRALSPEPLLQGERRLLSLPGDPEGTGGLYDPLTTDPVVLECRGSTASAPEP